MHYLSFLHSDLIVLIYNYINDYDGLMTIYKILKIKKYTEENFNILWISKVLREFDKLLLLLFDDRNFDNINHKLLDEILYGINVFFRFSLYCKLRRVYQKIINNFNYLSKSFDISVNDDILVLLKLPTTKNFNTAINRIRLYHSYDLTINIKGNPKYNKLENLLLNFDNKYILAYVIHFNYKYLNNCKLIVKSGDLINKIFIYDENCINLQLEFKDVLNLYLETLINYEITKNVVRFY
jgi:hypothetical protein